MSLNKFSGIFAEWPYSIAPKVIASGDTILQEINGYDMNLVIITKNIPITLSPAWRNKKEEIKRQCF